MRLLVWAAQLAGLAAEHHGGTGGRHADQPALYRVLVYAGQGLV
jgi:hypothetical protein